MDLHRKLRILADAAKYDASCASSGVVRKRRSGQLGNAEGMGICHSYTPDGRCVSLLKILLTNFCIYDCLFCVNRVSSDTPRARFTPAEVIRLTIDFYKRNYIEGLFLSSGIIQSVDYTMEQLAAVARGLREDHGFNGYIHLKVVPGASPELVAAAGRYADRLSANIELPTQTDLTRLAPAKSHEVIERSMTEIRSRIEGAAEGSATAIGKPGFAPAGQSTQLIVGATGTSDAFILATSESLYAKHKLRRVYYSAFSPIPHGDPQLPAVKIPLVREHRLYQADWLHRYYGFAMRELTESADSNLDLDLDPKLAWALRNRAFFPVDLNRASRSVLLRVPGLGTRTVDRILATRKHCAIRFADLSKLRVPLDRVKFFVCTADHNPHAYAIDTEGLKDRLRGAGEQLPLFSPSKTAVTGEL